MSHPAMAKDNVAVITGGASGIGLAAAMRFAALGMKVCIADVGADALKEAEEKLATVSPGGTTDVMAALVDVSRADALSVLESAVRTRFGGTDILMNNAGISTRKRENVRTAGKLAAPCLRSISGASSMAPKSLRAAG